MPTIVAQRLESLADTHPEIYEVLKGFQDQLNQVLPSIISGTGKPGDANVNASPGAVYFQRNPDTGALAIHVKDSNFDKSGWAQLGAFGSIPPTSAAGFQYTSDTSSITWYYDGTHGSQVLTIFRANGDKVTIPAGFITISGLAAGTTYLFYPYYDERTGSLQWIAGTVGNPAIAFAVATSNASQQQRLTHRIPMGPSSGMSAATTSSGTGGGTGGGGRGGIGRLE